MFVPFLFNHGYATKSCRPDICSKDRRFRDITENHAINLKRNVHLRRLKWHNWLFDSIHVKIGIVRLTIANWCYPEQRKAKLETLGVKASVLSWKFCYLYGALICSSHCQLILIAGTDTIISSSSKVSKQRQQQGFRVCFSATQANQVSF